MTKFWDKKLRDKEIVRLSNEGRKILWIADKLGVSNRTVQRALKTEAQLAKVHGMTAKADQVLAEIWDNKKDAAYDQRTEDS